MSFFTKVRDSVAGFVSSISQAILGFAGPLLRSIAQNGGQVLANAAMAAVLAAETSGGNGDDKLAAARKAVQNTLREKGIPIVINAVNGAIEAAVAKLKTPGA